MDSIDFNDMKVHLCCETWFVLKHLQHRFFPLINLVARRRLCPEWIYHDTTQLAHSVIDFLETLVRFSKTSVVRSHS